MFKTASDANDETHLYTRRYFVSGSRIDAQPHQHTHLHRQSIAGENARARPDYVAAAVVASAIRVDCVEHMRLSGLRPIHAYVPHKRRRKYFEEFCSFARSAEHLIRAWIWRCRIDALCSLVLPPRDIHTHTKTPTHTSSERRTKNPVFYRNATTESNDFNETSINLCE